MQGIYEKKTLKEVYEMKVSPLEFIECVELMVAAEEDRLILDGTTIKILGEEVEF